jgi:hypothetical protein
MPLKIVVDLPPFFCLYTVNFEADNIKAARDIVHFQQMLKMLGLPKARELVLASSDNHSACAVSNMILELAKATEDPEKRFFSRRSLRRSRLHSFLYRKSGILCI